MSLFAADTIVSSGLPWEAVAIIVSVVVTLGAASIGLLMQLKAQLARIDATIRSLQKSEERTQTDRTRVWERLDEHGERITVLEQRPQCFKETE